MHVVFMSFGSHGCLHESLDCLRNVGRVPARACGRVMRMGGKQSIMQSLQRTKSSCGSSSKWVRVYAKSTFLGINMHVDVLTFRQ